MARTVAGAGALLLSTNAAWACIPSSVSGYSSTTPTCQNTAAVGHSVTTNVNSIAEGMANAAIGGAVAGLEFFPTGRIRTTSHDGYLTNSLLGAGRTGGFDAKEASYFATASFSAPGQVLGANVRFTGLAGQTFLTVDQRGGPFSPNQGTVARTDIVATMLGGSMLMSWRSGWYAVGTAIGFLGNTETVDRVNALRAEYDNRGMVASLTVGRVMPLDDVMRGLKLDLRGGVSYNTYEGDSFRVLNTVFTPSLSFWTATFQPMLFADLPMSGGTLRPYLQGTVRAMGAYDNQLRVNVGNGAFVDTIQFNQHQTYLGAELGLNYITGRWTFGGAVYTDQSHSEQTYGAKLGASYRFGN